MTTAESAERDDNQDADGVRSDTGYGGAPAYDVPPTTPDAVDDPAAAQASGSDEDTIGSVIEQVHAEAGGESKERIAEILHQRLSAAGVHVEADRLAGLVAEIDAR